MNALRIGDALAEAGGWPDVGRVLVLRPRAGDDLTALAPDRAQIVTGFRPDHDRFKAQGWASVCAPEGSFGAALIFLPRARAQFRALVHQAASLLPEGGLILIDGQKTDGIDSAMKDIRARTPLTASLSKGHGRCFAFHNPGPTAFEGWQAVPHQAAPGFTTVPGVFSADGPDPGSMLLARHLPREMKGRMVDLGAGWGWLAAQVLTRPEVRELHLVEAEADALACARQNVTDPRALFHWADATTFDPGHRFDLVVMNPPFHTSRAADPDLGLAFIRAAQRLLHPSGQLWLVANRTLPYEETLRAAFLEQAVMATEGGFKVIRAAKPRFVKR